MQNRHTSTIALIILLLTTSAVSAETTRCTAITTLPHTITKQGNYCLFRSLSFKSGAGPAIRIDANNVMIDFNGHSLINVAPRSASGPDGVTAEDRQNITISNGGIRGFRRGLHFLDSSTSGTASQRHLVEGMRVSNCSQHGIHVRGSDTIFRNNQVVETGPGPFAAIGMYLRGRSSRAINNDISYTRASGSLDAIGLLVEVATGAVVEHNRIDTVRSALGDSFGIKVAASNDVLVSDSRISNTKSGLVFNSFSARGKYMDNLTSNVGTAFIGGTAVGTND